MLRYLKRAMRERLSAEPPAVLGVLPVALLLVSGPAYAQNDNPSFRFEERPEIQFNLTRREGARPIEQVIVRGKRSPSAYRRRVELAVEETWGAFNAVNSDDAFDVRCRYEAPTGTRMLQHVCRPQFLDDATSRAARAFLQLDKGSSFGLQQFEAMIAYYMERRLRDELRNLATWEPALREQLEILDEQLERYEESRHSQN